MQGARVHSLFFILYGGIMVKFTGENNGSVGDVVRGGNVLGEEAFFVPSAPIYKESATVESNDAAVLQVSAETIADLGTSNFPGKGQNQRVAL
jgi:hypothetical protein